MLERESIYEKLNKIKVPTLVAVGMEDVATSPVFADRITQGIKGAKPVLIPKAGHGVTLEQPQAVTATIAAFLGEQRLSLAAAA